MPIHALLGRFGVKWGMELLAVLSLWECSNFGLTYYKSNGIKIGYAV